MYKERDLKTLPLAAQSQKPWDPANLNRRQVLSMIAACSASSLITGCSSSGGSGGSDDATTVDPGETGGGTSNPTTWASGGTAAMTAEFPPASDPLDLSLGNVMCTISGTGSSTIGPCYFDVDDFREDISDGQPGVPMTLALKVVDANCDPIADAIVEVWWANWAGVYSGDDSDAAGNVAEFDTSFCTANDTDALASRWFRGVQATDSVGNVYFKACFPGWYSTRTSHIHFRVVIGGVERLVSQFCFADDLADDIYVNHPDYTGQPKDTSNASDFVFGNDVDDFVMIVDQQSDGSMLAYKGIQIV